MAFKYLSGAYNNGYALSANYTGLVIEATAKVQGKGASASFTAEILNYGYAFGGGGYAGVQLGDGGSVVNGSATDRTASIEGHFGIFAQGASATVVNFGGIGGGGYGVLLADGGMVTNGSAADETASIGDGIDAKGAAATITNFAHIGGGVGAGVSLAGGGRVINGSATVNDALINGANGVYTSGARSTVVNYGTVQAIGAGFGVDLENGGTVINGSVSDAAALITGANGVLVTTSGSASISNFGTIDGVTKVGVDLRAGAVTNGSSTTTAALIEGDEGIVTSGVATITNFGTITGTGGTAVALGSAGDLLQVEAGSVFLGAVMGDEATLDLASGAGTISSLAGGDVTVPGSVPTTTFSNFGTLEISAGANFTLAGTGAVVPDAVAALADAGILAVDEDLTYAGAFTEAAGATLAVATADKLTLTGAASVAGTIDGAGTVKVSNATFSGLTIGGAAILSDAGSAIQTGTLTIGDTTAKAAQLVIAVGATYTIENDAAVDRGHAATSSLKNSGTLISTGTGVTLVAVKTVDTGSIVAADGTLEFNKAMTGTGSMAVDAGATLELTSTAAATLSMTFAGADATLALKDPSKFAATITGFAAGDTIDLVDKKATSAVLGAGDTLVITNGKAAVATLQLTGDYSGDTFSVASDGAGGTDVTVSAALGSATPLPAAGHQFIAAMAGMGAAAGGAISGAGEVRPETFRPTLAAPRMMQTA